MDVPQPLTPDERQETKAICDQICEWLETHDEYAYDLNERRGKAGSFLDHVWDEAIRVLGNLRLDARRTGALVTVRKG